VKKTAARQSGDRPNNMLAQIHSTGERNQFGTA
jgi:hypothetical protein